MVCRDWSQLHGKLGRPGSGGSARVSSSNGLGGRGDACLHPQVAGRQRVREGDLESLSEEERRSHRPSANPIQTAYIRSDQNHPFVPCTGG